MLMAKLMVWSLMEREQPSVWIFREGDKNKFIGEDPLLPDKARRIGLHMFPSKVVLETVSKVKILQPFHPGKNVLEAMDIFWDRAG